MELLNSYKELDFHKLVGEVGKEHPDIQNYDAYCILEKQGFKFTQEQFTNMFFDRGRGKSIELLYGELIDGINCLNKECDISVIPSYTIDLNIGNRMHCKFHFELFCSFFLDKLKDIYEFSYDAEEFKITMFKKPLEVKI